MVPREEVAAGLKPQILILLSATAAVAGLSVLVRGGGTGVYAQEPTFSSEVATTISDVVPPVVSTVVPVVEQVQPGSVPVEVSTGQAGDAALDDGADGTFTGVRGVLIGAAIGVGIVALIAAGAAGFRLIARRGAS